MLLSYNLCYNILHMFLLSCLNQVFTRLEDLNTIKSKFVHTFSLRSVTLKSLKYLDIQFSRGLKFLLMV